MSTDPTKPFRSAQFEFTEEHGRTIGALAGLFDTAPEDVRAAFARHATLKNFGTLARDFFARFVGRCLNYFLSRELPNHVGEGVRFDTLADHAAYTAGLNTHCREAAAVIERFAGDWLSKEVFESGGQIDREAAGRFAHGAMAKLADELRRGGRRLMPTPRAILCGGVPDGRLPLDDPDPVRLCLDGSGANVNFRIEDVHQALVQELPPAFLDLLEIAAYVYAADQAVPRGGSGVTAVGDRWRRRFFFRLPVRDPDFWSTAAVLGPLTAALSFLTEDEYLFEFVPGRGRPPSLKHYLDFGTTPFSGAVDEVVMFSGGLDSLGGAVEEAVVQGRRVLLANHRSTGKMAGRHRALVAGLTDRAGVVRPFQVPVRMNKAKGLGREFTQRSRSFAFAAFGATFAAVIGLDRLRFYENGVVSLNLPVSEQAVGARASRTTHPRSLAGFAALLTAVAGRPFAVENPFLWHTKADVLRGIAAAGCPELVRLSTSCGHTWERTNRHTHCGRCSQCIDRRFAVLAAGLADHDPAGCYAADLFTSPRPEGEARAMLVGYAETANAVERMTPLDFFTRFGETARALRHLPGGADAAARRMFDLLKRHAAEVNRVIDDGVRAHATAIRQRTLADTYLIRLVAGGPTAIADAPVAAETRPDNYFECRGSHWAIRYNGGPEKLYPASKGFAYLHALLTRGGRPVPAEELAREADGDRPRCALGSAGEQCDDDALAAYRRRSAALQEELDDARERGDDRRVEAARTETAALAAEVRRGEGLGGRKRTAADDRDRVRKAVGNAVRRAV
jgi:hypothetical protein